MSAEGKKCRIASADLSDLLFTAKATLGSWQTTMSRRGTGETSYRPRIHTHASIAIDPYAYWEDGYKPPVDEDGYYQPDERMDCDEYTIAVARLISHLPDIAKELLEKRNDIDALIAALKEVQWQPIETAPTDGTLILVCRTGMRETPRIVLFMDGAWWSAGGQWISDTRSRWMPLPKPPAEEGSP
ncbi:hypothetical protein ACRC7T_18200 [Segnochrobactraceae bacterium EtOH-i3]